MLHSDSLENLFFIDIETVPCTENLNDLDAGWQALWLQKARYDPAVKSGELALEKAWPRAGIYAEFGKIICIGMGYFVYEKKQWQARIKSISNADEKILLAEFAEIMHSLDSSTRLCAHNGKEFDFPYLCRRLIVNRIVLPHLLDLGGKKPWEIPHIDTLEWWKFGDHKSYASLSLMAKTLGLPPPKEELDGSKIFQTYYAENNLKAIANYCKNDVLTLMNVYLRLKLLQPLSAEQVVNLP